MATRFRKSIKVAPGLKVNIGKKSVSLTAGVKGAHITKSTSGRTTKSVSIPGTGLSYVKTTEKSKTSKSAEKSTARTEPINNITLYEKYIKSGYIFSNDGVEFPSKNKIKFFRFASLKRYKLFFNIFGVLLLIGGLTALPIGLIYIVISLILFSIAHTFSNLLKAAQHMIH